MNTWNENEKQELNSVKSNEIQVGVNNKKANSNNLDIRNIFWEFNKDFLTYASIDYQHFHHDCLSPNATYTNGPIIKTPEPKLTVLSSVLPKTWDWRDIDGVNYLSWTVNQHIPKYCGSCWAQATTSALADRFIIADKDKYANLALSPQVIVNCRAGGSCEGGNPGGVYEFAYKVGVSLHFAILCLGRGTCSKY